MNVTSLFKDSPRQETLTLDVLWKEATRIGQVEIEPETWSSNVYKVQIRFKRRSGSMVWAEGKSTSIMDAMMAAIEEAQLLVSAKAIGE